VRLGTLESFAVLDIREAGRPGDRAADGLTDAARVDLVAALRRAAPSVPSDPGSALLAYLDELNRSRRRWPTSSRLHLVTDGGGPVGLPALREALAVRARISVHTARVPALWPGMVAGWLAMTGNGDGAALTELDRVRSGLAPGEVFGWIHAPGRTPVVRRRSPTVN
jgi:hypothetical protein